MSCQGKADIECARVCCGNVCSFSPHLRTGPMCTHPVLSCFSKKKWSRALLTLVTSTSFISSMAWEKALFKFTVHSFTMSKLTRTSFIYTLYWTLTFFYKTLMSGGLLHSIWIWQTHFYSINRVIDVYCGGKPLGEAWKTWKTGKFSFFLMGISYRCP